MTRRTLTTREQVLLTLGIFVLLGAAQLFFRILPRRKELASLDARIAQLEAALAPRAAAPSDPEAARILSHRDELAKRVEAERASLAKLDRFFPKDESAALVAISDLAERTGVLVRESEPYRDDKDDLARPRRRFVVAATFPALRSFVAGLASLPENPVHVERLDLEAVTVPVEGAEDEGPAEMSVLLATFVIVL
jgi:hypothetical protein